MSKLTISEETEDEIYKIISLALIDLCENKPNDPVDHLSKKMFELIGEDPNQQRRRVKRDSTKRVGASALFSKSEVALANLSKNIEEFYKIGKKIQGNLFKAVDLKDSSKKVVRILIKKKNPNFSIGEKKIKLLYELEHAHIQKVVAIFEDKKRFQTVEDFCPGGDLGSFLFANKEKITMELLKEILRQVIYAIQYLHNNNLIHMDLSFDKIYIFNPSTDPKKIIVKVGGFTFSELFIPGMTINAGLEFTMEEPLFAAPEFYDKKYDNKVDMWSLGILSYLMLIGEEPFKDDPDVDVRIRVTKNELTFPENTDPEIKTFLKGLLNKRPDKRFSAKEALDSEFLKPEENEDSKNYLLNIASLTALTNFEIGEELRRSVLTYIMSKKLYDETNLEAINTFKMIDVDNSGDIDFDEFFERCGNLFEGNKAGKRKKSARKLMMALDLNGNGKLDYAEFLTVMTLMNKELSINTLRQVFDFFDHDKKGAIDAAGLREIFEATDVTVDEINEMIDRVDPNGDREISFEEFKNIILPT
ncbi:MAG: protein kinase, partial [archaeon]|nr:protein kinase [archaeon]